jgi:hypothetical protein
MQNQRVELSNMSKTQRKRVRDLSRQVGVEVEVTRNDQGVTLSYANGDQQISHSGTDLNAVIVQAQQARNARVPTDIDPLPEITEIVVPEIVPAPEVETFHQDVEDAEKVAEVAEAVEAVEADADRGNVIDIMQALAKVPVRRAVLTPEDVMPKTLTNVILDNTGQKTPRVRVAKEKTVKQPNRLARALRAILENPTLTVAEQAAIADVTVPMLGYYEIQLRSVWNIIYEKFGEDAERAVPMLPKLIKK